MHKLNEEIREYYMSNPESLETRRLILWEHLENRIKEFNVDHLMKEAFTELELMWKTAVSYWVFPDMEDINKMLDDIHRKNQNV